MARDPDRGGAFVFDLIDDGAADREVPPALGAGGEGDPDGDQLEPLEPDADGPVRRLRALVPVAAVLAVLLGTSLAVDGVRDHARMDRVRDVHGGVVDLSSPLEEVWSWEGAVGLVGAADDGRWTEVALLGDLLAFQSDEHLVALDPATGAEEWRLGLGADPDCGPQGTAGWNEAVTRRLVCLVGAGPDRTVLVVEPDGSVSAGRVLHAADTRRYGPPRPGPDGTVLRARRVGPEPPADEGEGDAECTDAGRCTGTVEAGRGLALRAEDAVTGAERWNLTVPFRSTRADQCTNWYATSWDGSGNTVDVDDLLDAEGFGARITGGLVQLYGCGVDTTVTTNGTLLGTEVEPGTGVVESLRTGGYAGYSLTDPVRTVLYGAEGGVVGEVDGYALQPSVVDGSGPDTLMASGESGARLRSYEQDGTPRWDVAARAGTQVFLAQVGDSAIVLTGAGTVRGLDLRTGEETWTWDRPAPAGEYPNQLYVSRAFTDGQFVLLVTDNGYAGGGLVVLDAVSGEVAWERHGAEPGTGAWVPGSGLVAVDGNLLEITPDGVRGLG